MVGMSTSGSGETGSLKNAMAPATTSPSDSSVVATGRRMKGVERLITWATGVVTEELLPGSAPMQKAHYVTAAAIRRPDFLECFGMFLRVRTEGWAPKSLHRHAPGP